jgi:hypothetical protein
VPLQPLPRTPEKLGELAWENAIVAFDHVSSLPPSIDAALCRLSTGGAFEHREPYARSAVTFQAARPLLFASQRPPEFDLDGRVLHIELPALQPEQMRTPAQLWSECNALRAELGGALCTAAAMALRRLPETPVPAIPHHAAAAQWLLAAAPALDLTPEDILQALSSGPESELCAPLATAGEAPLDAIPASRSQDGPRHAAHCRRRRSAMPPRGLPRNRRAHPTRRRMARFAPHYGRASPALNVPQSLPYLAILTEAFRSPPERMEIA